MKKIAISLAAATLLPAFACAQTEENPESLVFYGDLNLSLQSTDEGEDSYSDIRSNASNIGIKGTLPLRNEINAIYKMEYQVNIDGDSDETFTKRNIYAGFEGGFGQIIGGRFDTPLKVIQNKVDLFSDLEGDIKSIITNSENRLSDSLQYTTPSFNNFKATVSYISNKNESIPDINGEPDAETRDNGVSSSVSYENGPMYFAYAYDQSVEEQDWDVHRWVAKYQFFDALTLGGLYETEEQRNGSKQDGWIASAAYKINDWTMKAQYGQSDIVEEDGETYSLGLDYKLSSAVKVFGFWTDETADNDYDRRYFGVGTELKF